MCASPFGNVFTGVVMLWHLLTSSAKCQVNVKTKS